MEINKIYINSSNNSSPSGKVDKVLKLTPVFVRKLTKKEEKVGTIRIFPVQKNEYFQQIFNRCGNREENQTFIPYLYINLIKFS
jgi:hypothetical protein